MVCVLEVILFVLDSKKPISSFPVDFDCVLTNQSVQILRYRSLIVFSMCIFSVAYKYIDRLGSILLSSYGYINKRFFSLKQFPSLDHFFPANSSLSRSDLISLVAWDKTIVSATCMVKEVFLTQVAETGCMILSRRSLL